MQIDFVTYLILCPLIFLSGFLDSIAGGGGVISIPAYMLAGLPAHMAIGTNKISVAMGVSTSTVRYAKNKMVDYKTAVIGAVLSIIGSSIGARLVMLVAEDFLNYMMLIILPAVAVFTLTNKKLSDEDDINRVISPLRRIATFVMIFFLGAYSGFYGPGYGTFLILSLVQIGGFSVKTAAGTAKFINLGGVVGALFVFLRNGQAQLMIGLIAGCFCLLGNFVGSGLVLKNGSKIVRPIIIVVLLLLFAKIMWGLIAG